MSRHALCKLPSNDLQQKRTPTPSRHDLCKLPSNDRQPKRIPAPIQPSRYAANNRPKTIPESIQPVPSAVGIIGQVLKVSADVSELQKTMATELAARNELQMCMEQLKVETSETKKYLAQQLKNGNRRSSGKQTLQLLMKTLPCKTLVELDWLLAYIENRTSQWTDYVKLLGGSDFNSAIKQIINTIMDKSVQKQLSWSGQQTEKPSLKYQYKPIVDGIHVALKENFKDYTIVQGEKKMQNLLLNATKCKT